jgi:hypothetical protein
MNNKEMLKQIIDLNKKSFDNCFLMMVTLQLQAENIFNFFHYFPIISDEGKKIMDQRTNAYKKWIDDLKKAMDEGYAKVETFFDSDATNLFHDKTQKMFNSYLTEVTWMPQNLKKTMEELDATYKKSCDEFNQYVDENIQSLKNFYAITDKSQTKTRQRK